MLLRVVIFIEDDEESLRGAGTASSYPPAAEQGRVSACGP